jgi:hypothetical protein
MRVHGEAAHHALTVQQAVVQELVAAQVLGVQGEVAGGHVLAREPAVALRGDDAVVPCISTAADAHIVVVDAHVASSSERCADFDPHAPHGGTRRDMAAGEHDVVAQA